MNILITGGSSGIGLCLSKLWLARKDIQLIWISKSEDEIDVAKLELLKSHPQMKLTAKAFDLSNISEQINAIEWVESLDVTIDVLINNAGFGTYGYVHEIDCEQEIKMLNLNIIALFRFTKHFLPQMVKRNQGCIINLSSVSALRPVPRMASYASTKSFVKHLGEGIQSEMAYINSKVRVITVCPAPVGNSPFKDLAGMSSLRTFNSIATVSKEEVALDIMRAYDKGHNFVLTGKKMRRFNLLMNILPKSILNYIVKRELDPTS